MMENQSQPNQRLGLRATARQLGIAHPSLLKAWRSGRVERAEDGSFDVEACRLELAQNTNPIKSASARAQQAPASAVTEEQEFQPIRPAMVDAVEQDPGPRPGSMADVSLQLESERLRALKLKTDREEGRLVELAPVNAWIAGMILKARDEFGRIPLELRDVLASETDPVRCEELLQVKVQTVLATMSEYRQAA